MSSFVLMFLKIFLEEWNGALFEVIFCFQGARFGHTTPCFNSFM
jgi:hypothetical protein